MPKNTRSQFKLQKTSLRSYHRRLYVKFRFSMQWDTTNSTAGQNISTSKHRSTKLSIRSFCSRYFQDTRLLYIWLALVLLQESPFLRCRSSRLEVFCRKGVLRKFRKIHRKTPALAQDSSTGVFL